MSRSSARRAQVEPTAALVAVLAVCAGIGLYADVLGAAVGPSDRDVASPTLERVHNTVTADGVVLPTRVGSSPDVGPMGYSLNVTLRTAGNRWTAGPAIPPDAETAGRLVSARLAPGRIVTGRLRVGVWT